VRLGLVLHAPRNTSTPLPGAAQARRKQLFILEVVEQLPPTLQLSAP
jgi:hypothetical protein